MKTYIFLTNLLGGYSGGPSYVRNKKEWLERQGWKVFAYDSTGLGKRICSPIEFKEQIICKRYKEELLWMK